jgi:hypothetical protein
VEEPRKSEYNGKPSSPDSIKKTVDFQGLKVRIDRPKGFVMRGTSDDGKAWERTYKFDYGWLPRTKGGDGDGLDVFIGPNPKATSAFWALQKKPDGSFDEYKAFLGFPDRKSAIAAYKEHIPSKYLAGMMALSVDMMKSLLNIEPNEKLAVALYFMDELNNIISSGFRW